MSELYEKDLAVLRFIRSHGDPTLAEILRGVADYTQHTVRATAKHLVRSGYIIVRMKDDDQEHDFTYRLNERGRWVLS